MNKKADSVMPIPAVGGWVLILIAAVIVLMIMANAFGFIDSEFLRGFRLG